MQLPNRQEREGYVAGLSLHVAPATRPKAGGQGGQTINFHALTAPGVHRDSNGRSLLRPRGPSKLRKRSRTGRVGVKSVENCLRLLIRLPTNYPEPLPEDIRLPCISPRHNEFVKWTRIFFLHSHRGGEAQRRRLNGERSAFS